MSTNRIQVIKSRMRYGGDAKQSLAQVVEAVKELTQGAPPVHPAVRARVRKVLSNRQALRTVDIENFANLKFKYVNKNDCHVGYS